MTESKVQTPIEDFDWDSYESGAAVGEKSREELMTNPLRLRKKTKW
jgi:hypothetical protein